MRPEEGNPLDLNNLPGEDYSGGHRKKKNGGGKDEIGKVYECRFCSLKFGKSQALGGHMNRHRQERETETLNRARQLVFSNDNLLPPTPPHHALGGQLPISHGGYHHHYHHQTSDPFRVAAYNPPPRFHSGASSSANIPPPPPPPEPYMYPSPPRLMPYPPSHYSINPPDYFVGHAVLSTSQVPSYTAPPQPPPPENMYTCIGAPVGRGFGQGGGGSTRDMSSVQNYNIYSTSTRNYKDSNNNEVEDDGRS